jgi:hypothetical protein
MDRQVDCELLMRATTKLVLATCGGVGTKTLFFNVESERMRGRESSVEELSRVQ